MRMDDSEARKSLMREKMRPPSDNSSKIDLSAVAGRSLASEEKSKEPEGPEVPDGGIPFPPPPLPPPVNLQIIFGRVPYIVR